MTESQARRRADEFRDVVDEAAAAFCAQQGYPPTTAEWSTVFAKRIPVGLCWVLGDALQRGSVEIPGGSAGFVLPALLGKGPYALFSRSAKGVPAPNWEYFVQVAEYARLVSTAEARGWRVGFEDGLMDVSVYDDSGLLWCIEVKEQAKGLRALVSALSIHGRGIDGDAPDRHDDPLRKAKYLLKHRPAWFSAVAIGERHDFTVRYDNDHFELDRDVLPL